MLACAPQGRTRPTVTACASAEEDATCTCLYPGAEGRDSKASAEAHVRLVPTHSFVPGAQLPQATRFVHYVMNSKPRPRKRASRSPLRVAITPQGDSTQTLARQEPTCCSAKSGAQLDMSRQSTYRNHLVLVRWLISQTEFLWLPNELFASCRYDESFRQPSRSTQGVSTANQ